MCQWTFIVQCGFCDTFWSIYQPVELNWFKRPMAAELNKGCFKWNCSKKKEKCFSMCFANGTVADGHTYVLFAQAHLLRIYVQNVTYRGSTAMLLCFLTSRPIQRNFKMHWLTRGRTFHLNPNSAFYLFLANMFLYVCLVRKKISIGEK